MLLNTNNVLVWGVIPPEPEHLDILPVGTPGVVSAVVLLVPGEVYLFYLNAPNGLTVSNSNVDLIADNAALTVVAANIGTLTGIPVASTGLPHEQQIITINGLPNTFKEELYRFRITTPTGFIYSNRVIYKPISQPSANTLSAIFSFRSTRDFADVPYEAPELVAFRQSIRLMCRAGNPQNDTNVENYKAKTTGRVRTTEINENLFRAFTVDYADAIAHEGFSTVLGHKDLLVNGQKMQLKTAFNSSTDQQFLATGTFELWIVRFALVNRA